MVSLECLGRDEFYNMLKIIVWLQIIIVPKNWSMNDYNISR